MTVAEVLNLWPSSKAIADDLGLSDSAHARMFRTRNKIPGWHWESLMVAAEKRGLPLTQAALIEAHKAVRVIGAPAWASKAAA